MFNFDEPRFVTIQSNAVEAGVALRELVTALVRDGAQNLYFLGAGGAGVLMEPAAQLVQRLSTFPAQVVQAAEILATDAVPLGSHSIVVIPSLSGTTREALDVLRFAKSKGATVITLTGHEDTPVAQEADHNFTVFAEDDTSSESFYLQSLLLVLALLEATGDYQHYDRVAAELRTLPRLLLEAKRAYEPTSVEFATHIQAHDFHIISGAGSTWPEAWYYGTCILEEMQWIKTRPIHAADFFHGTLELLEENTSLLLFKGEDASRAIVERVEAWAPDISRSVRTIDTAEVNLPGISADVRALISPVVISTLLERVSAHLEELTQHPLTTRRYYRQVAY
ncbi:SIS domain-containing protein [Lacisediminihabitans profunda]|uniref:SIS domain-containing protein n=1 Tax=Lacisediminihabitans profunda TaxID=2594790 RepID=A0A5C8UPI4_9MICO|nr:SIS domain-containing protein [Lacisediminihabitans profunda]TXN29791.1 SIS domain-containing protein [Lacisediminihabitans profunda]